MGGAAARAQTACVKPIQEEDQMKALKDQLQKMEKEERAALYQVLTPEQREKLRKIIAEKVGGDENPPEKKKGVDKKSPQDK